MNEILPHLIALSTHDEVYAAAWSLRYIVGFIAFALGLAAVMERSSNG